jgi:hypothetical protein
MIPAKKKSRNEFPHFYIIVSKEKKNKNITIQANEVQINHTLLLIYY